MAEIDGMLTELLAQTAPSLLALYGAGTDTTASLLITAGDNPSRLSSEGSWAHLCGATPLPANSGKVTTRFRLNRGGDRQANAALYRIVLTRMSSHEETRIYVARRRDEGLNTARDHAVSETLRRPPNLQTPGGLKLGCGLTPSTG